MSTGDGSTPTPESEQVPLRARGWGVPILLAAAVMVALLGGVALASKLGGGEDAQTLTYVVPEGTAEQVFLGRPVEIMPSEVRLKVGDTLEIRNDDIETVTVGPFTVRAGETLTQTFRRPQRLIGECSLSGSGEIEIIVT